MNTKNIKIKLYFSMILLFIVCGCGSFRVADQDARNTALIVNQRVLALKAQVRQKMDAERKYYSKEFETIQNAMEKTTYGEMRKKVIENAIADAKEMHENLETVTESSVADKLATNAKNLVDEFEVGAQKLREWRETTEKNIRKLKELNQEYSALERTLVKLSIPPNKQDQIIRVGKFIADSAKHYRDLEKARKEKEKTAKVDSNSNTQPGGD